MSEEVVSPSTWAWGYVKDTPAVPLAEAATYDISVFIDRGYIRLVDKTDSNCLDHGDHIKIAYCPFCGRKQAEEVAP